MTFHKFAIGQAVDFDRRFPSVSRPTGPFEVVSALPIGEDNSLTYRVKSNAEPFARVVRETDLVAVGSPPSKQTATALWADLVSGRRASPPLRSR